MSNSLIVAFIGGLTETLPFRSMLVPRNSRPNEALWEAVNTTNLKLRLPLYWDQLRKPRPKQPAYNDAIQHGLAVLASFAMITDTKQAIVRIERGNATAVSFQPRFADCNWTRDHGIQPVALQMNYSDPLLESDLVGGPTPLTMDVATRDIVHMSRKVADAVVKSSTTTMFVKGTATFDFSRRSSRPEARVIYRPLQANEPATVVTLAT